ncbi:MAG: type IVB secretion system protein IcmV [Legionellaceae bacterium]|nr:type IVB secretion system protein IcmV [Legionellaceae bacterium]
MKKQKSSRILQTLKQIFNVRYWSDFDRIKAFWHYMVRAFKKLFVPPTEPRQGSMESFEEAIKKMHMSQADLDVRQRALKRLSILMLTFAILIFGYSFYHLFWGAWPGFYLSLVVSFLALVLAFRYHFWYYQIKSRKLGCSFAEWFRQGLLGDQ